MKFIVYAVRRMVIHLQYGDATMNIKDHRNIFIIGNGFDVALGLYTQYSHFKKYLIKTYGCDSLDKSLPIPYIAITKGTLRPNCFGSGKFYVEMNNSLDLSSYAKICFSLINDAEKSYYEENKSLKWDPDKVMWRDFETLLGMINFDKKYAEYNKNYGNEYADRHSDIINNAISVLKSHLFFEWIRSVDVRIDSHHFNGSFAKGFRKLLQFDDFAISFNYTDTLEMKDNHFKICKYNIKHIHGMRATDDLEKQKTKNTVYGDNTRELIIGCKDSSKYTSTRNEFAMVADSLVKDTGNIIKNNLNAYLYFVENSGIDNVYSCGFSYSEVDKPYLKEICKALAKKNTIWYLYDYDTAENIRSSLTIRECGFKGNILGFYFDENGNFYLKNNYNRVF